MNDVAIETWASTRVPYNDTQIVQHGRFVQFLSEIVAVVDQYRHRDLQMMSHGVFEAKQTIFCFIYHKVVRLQGDLSNAKRTHVNNE